MVAAGALVLVAAGALGLEATGALVLEAAGALVLVEMLETFVHRWFSNQLVCR